MDQALSQVEDLAAQISAATSDVSLDVGVEVDASAAEAEIAALDPGVVDVPVEADVAPAEAEIANLDAPPVDVEVNADTSGAQAQLDGLSQSTEQASAGAGELGATLASSGTSGLIAATGYAAVGAAAIGAVQAFGDADRVLAIATERIDSLGSSAVTSVDDITALSSELQQTAGVSDEAVTSAQTLLLTFENLSNGAVTTEENFQRATRAIFDISTVQGNAQSNAIALGKALEDPVAGLGRLGRAGITFTESQKEVIASLVEAGDVAGAQALILDEIEDKYGGLAAAAGDSLGGRLDIATEKVGELAETLGGALAPAVLASVDDLNSLVTAAQTVGGAIDEIVSSAGDGEDEIRSFGSGLADAFRGSVSPISKAAGIVEQFGDLFGEDDFMSIPEFTAYAAFDAQLQVLITSNLIATATAEAGAGAYAGEAVALGDVATAASEARAQLDELNGVQQSLDAAQIALAEGQDAITAAFLRNGRNVDINTEAGRENVTVLREQGENMRDYLEALDASGASAAEVTAANRTLGGSLREQAVDAGLTRAAADELVRTYGRFPGRVNTDLDANPQPAYQGVNDAVGYATANWANKTFTATLGVSTGAAVADLLNLQDTAKNVGAAIAALESSPSSVVPLEPVSGAPVSAGPVLAPIAIGETNIEISVGAGVDAQAVGDAVGEAMAAHRRKLSILTSQP